MRTRFLCSILCALPGISAALSDDFVSFRGPNGLGVTANQAIPDSWSDTENLAWKVTVPGSGWSQPIVVVWQASRDKKATSWSGQ